MVHHILRYVNGPFKDFKVEACMVFLMTNCSPVYSKQKKMVREILLQNVDGSPLPKELKQTDKDDIDLRNKGAIQRDMSFGTQPAQGVSPQLESGAKKSDSKKLKGGIPGTPFAAFKSKNTSFSNFSGGVLAQMSNKGPEQESPRRGSEWSGHCGEIVLNKEDASRKSTNLLSPKSNHKSILQSSGEVRAAPKAQVAAAPMSHKTSFKRNKDDDTSSYDPLQPKRPEYTESSFHTDSGFYTDSSDARWYEDYKQNKEVNRQKDEAYRKEHLCRPVDH